MLFYTQTRFSILDKQEFFKRTIFIGYPEKISFGIGFAHMEVKGECVNLSSGDFSAKS